MNHYDLLDHRYKHKIREKKQFILWIKNPKSHIYYARYRSGKVISTKCTNIYDAYDVALNHLEKMKLNDLYPLHKVLNDYYVVGSKYLEYEIFHGFNNTIKNIKERHSKSVVLSNMLSDIKEFSELTKPRLIKLQKQLLSKGLSGKTVNGYITNLHNIYKYFIDNGHIKDDVFVGLRPCSTSKSLRLCFPMDRLKGLFSLDTPNEYMDLIHLAIISGMRKGEILRLSKSDIIKKDYGYWLHINGTKTENASREVPITDELVKVINRIDVNKFTDRFISRSVQYLSDVLGLKEGYIRENGIVFHSFRKTYKTILTSSNINKDLIEEALGHSQTTYSMNRVDKSYLCLERADRELEHSLFIQCLKYFY